MKNLLYLSLSMLVTLVLFLTGCNYPVQSQDAWLSQIDAVQIPESYTVHFYKTFTSSGGTRIWNYTYYVKGEIVISCEGSLTNSYSSDYSRKCNVSSEEFMTATSIKESLSTYIGWTHKKYGPNDCYYNLTNPSGDPMIAFVCFNGNNIVSYGGKGGYGDAYIRWYMNDNYPDPQLYI